MTGIRDISIFPEDLFDKNYLFESYLEYHLRAIVTNKGLNLLNNFIKSNLTQMLPKFISLFIHNSRYFLNKKSQLSLKEAVDFALQNNSMSKNAARDVEIAKTPKMGNNIDWDCHKLKQHFL